MDCALDFPAVLRRIVLGYSAEKPDSTPSVITNSHTVSVREWRQAMEVLDLGYGEFVRNRVIYLSETNG